jgi:hypothetical protein
VTFKPDSVPLNFCEFEIKAEEKPLLAGKDLNNFSGDVTSYSQWERMESFNFGVVLREHRK